MKTNLFYIFLLVILSLQTLSAQENTSITFPASFQPTTAVNVRAQPSVNGYKEYVLNPDTIVTIVSIDTVNGMAWGKIHEDYRTGYVCMKYLRPVTIEQEITKTEESDTGGLWNTILNWLSWAKKGFKILCIIAFCLLLYYFRDWVKAILGSYLIGALLGGLIGLFFSNGSTGVNIGCWIVTAGWLILAISHLGSIFTALPLKIVLLPLLPLYLLNQLQWFLIAPWRWFFRSDWLSEDTKSTLRPIFTFLTIILTIADTPLRLFNSCIYNSFHLIYDIYNYIIEVLTPSSDDEGAEDWVKWILWLPWRIIKYLIGHGLHSLLDSISYILIDIFYPSVTMYHGTSETAADNILADNTRNTYQQWHNDNLRGTFKASSSPQCSWAGLGVYFAKSIFLAYTYATSGRNSDGSDCILIACRVSYGLIISYNLAPYRVSCNTGQYGHHTEINNWTMANGYTTGEWWNGSNWEYCLFDWQNRYNYPWRIRPLYAFNLNTNFFHRIKGGQIHWIPDDEL